MDRSLHTLKDELMRKCFNQNQAIGYDESFSLVTKIKFIWNIAKLHFMFMKFGRLYKTAFLKWKT